MDILKKGAVELRVLITGAYGFISSNLALKFLKEGIDVVIIGNNRKDDFLNTKLRNKIYKINPANPECEKIFEAYNFDIVIYIAEWLCGVNKFIVGKSLNNKTPNTEELYNSEYNHEILSTDSGFINILNLSGKARIKRFIYISSADIYGNVDIYPSSEETRPNPVNINGIRDFAREYFCSKWEELYGLKTLCIRISDVYGPDCFETSGSGIINSFIEKILNNEEIIISGDGNNTKDFIYIDDAVDGIYRAVLKRDCTGKLNLSSNTEISINKLVELLSKIKKPEKISYAKTKRRKISASNLQIASGEILESVSRSWLDNNRIKSLLEWEPKIKIEEGLKRTLEWQENIFSSKVKRKGKRLKEKTAPSGEVMSEEAAEIIERKTGEKTALTVFENIILFFVFAFLQFGELYFKVKLPDLRIDLIIVYIIIAGVLWGQIQAYLALTLSVMLFIGVNIFSGVDIITFAYTPANIVQIAVYILVGIITGYTIERKNREIESRDANYQSLKNKYMFLLNIYNETRLIKNELESQIIDAEDSFSTIYEIVQEVESLEIERVFSGAVNAIERIMKTNLVSIYTLGANGNSDFMRLKARSLALADRIPNSIKISDFPQIKEVVETKSLYVNRTFEPGIPVMIAPVLDEKKVIAVISIHDMEFENLTMHYENLFMTVIGLITNAVKRAYIFEASLRDKRYLPKTRILTEETFEKILKEVRRNKEELDMSYSLLKVLNNNISYSEFSEKIISAVRENDYAGLSSDGNLYILLSNTKNNYAGIVIDRLSKIGIVSELVQEEFIHE